MASHRSSGGGGKGDNSAIRPGSKRHDNTTPNPSAIIRIVCRPPRHQTFLKIMNSVPFVESICAITLQGYRAPIAGIFNFVSIGHAFAFRAGSNMHTSTDVLLAVPCV